MENEEMGNVEERSSMTLEELKAKKQKREIMFEMALFFILGILLGVTIKTEALKKITIGFNDYKLVENKSSYDISKMKQDLIQEATEQQAAAQQNLQAPQTEQQPADQSADSANQAK